MMLNTSWLGKIATGRFETELLSLTMTNGYGDQFKGQGFLTWTNQDGLTINALTNGSEDLRRSFGQSPCPVGDLVPEEYYLRLEGTTGNGDTVEIRAISPHDYEISMGHSTVVWRITQGSVYSDVRITRPSLAKPESSLTTLLLSPSRLSWPRCSNTHCDNSYFGSTSSNFDWLEYDCSQGHIAARRLDNDYTEVRFKHSNDVSPEASLPVSVAFGFLAGRSVSIIGQETQSKGTLTRTLSLPSQKWSHNVFAPPLSCDPRFRNDCEPLLSKATDFFSTEVGKHARDLLHMCHMSVDSTFTIHTLVACVVLESLVKLLTCPTSSEPTLTTEQKEKIGTCLVEIGVNQRVVDRFNGFLGRLDNVSPKNQLHAWASGGVLGISRDDVRAWDDLRNKAAHGKLLMVGEDPDKERGYWTALRRVKNLIIKLFLDAMHYEAHYYDYADRQKKLFVGANPIE